MNQQLAVGLLLVGGVVLVIGLTMPATVEKTQRWCVASDEPHNGGENCGYADTALRTTEEPSTVRTVVLGAGVALGIVGVVQFIE